MALKQPLFFENNTDRQNADEVRLLVKGLLGGVTGETSGVAHPDHFKVTEKSGTPDMSVDVAAGHLFIEGSRNSAQGTYHLYNDATVNVPLSASDPTNPRIDIIYVRVRDSAYDAGFTGDDDAEILVAEGTPAAVPSAPTITDEDYIELARVTVGVGVSSIVNADIEDVRTFVMVPRPPVIARVRRVANQSINHSAETVIAFDTEDEDSAGMHSSGTFTIPPGEDGLYSCYVRWTTGAGANYTVVTAGGDTHVQVAGNPLVAWAHIIKWLEAGDTVQFRAAQNSGGAQNITAKAHVARLPLF